MRLENFMSWQWWVTAGIGSILLSLCSDLFRRALYGLLGKASTHWQERSNKSRADYDALVLRASSDERIYRRIERQEVRCRLNAIYVVVIACTGLLAGSLAEVLRGTPGHVPILTWPFEPQSVALQWVTAVFTLVFLLMALSSITDLSRATRYRNVLARADERSETATDTPATLPPQVDSPHGT